MDTDAHPDEDAPQKARHDGTDQIKQQLVLLFVDAFPIHPVDETGEDDSRRDIGQFTAEEDGEASRRQHRTDVADPRRLRLRVLDSLHTGSDVLRRRAGGANLTGEGIQLFYPVEVGGIASGDAPGLDDLVAVRRACRDLNKGGNGKHAHLMHPIGVEDAGDGILYPRHLTARQKQSFSHIKAGIYQLFFQCSHLVYSFVCYLLWLLLSAIINVHIPLVQLTSDEHSAHYELLDPPPTRICYLISSAFPDHLNALAIRHFKAEAYAHSKENGLLPSGV